MFVFIILMIMLVVIAGLAFVLGCRYGGDHWSSELTRVQAEAMDAQRQMHDLTRQAFVAMAEHAEAERRRHLA